MGRKAGKFKRIDKSAWAIAAIVLIAVSGTSHAGGNARNGEIISRQHCARCHVVAEDMPFAGIGSTPSFMLLVNSLTDWEDRFSTFYSRRPHPVHIRVEGFDPWTDLPSNAAPIHLKLADIDDILAYARTLKKSGSVN